MKDKVFIDTNIFVYSALDDEEEKVKREKAIELLKQFSDKQTIVSTQILNEFYSVLLKHNIPDKDIQDKLNTIIKDSMVSLIRVETIKNSWELRAKYNISFWDSLIVASALENECQILYSEDLHHSQLIESRLRILNPFNLRQIPLTGNGDGKDSAREII
jgi:predicted nucleic acid-binding protein